MVESGTYKWSLSVTSTVIVRQLSGEFPSRVGCGAGNREPKVFRAKPSSESQKNICLEKQSPAPGALVQGLKAVGPQGGGLVLKLPFCIDEKCGVESVYGVE